MLNERCWLLISVTCEVVKKFPPPKSGNSMSNGDIEILWRLWKAYIYGLELHCVCAVRICREHLFIHNRAFDINEAGYAENLHLQTCK
jgi:hypothetical protein